MEFYQTAMGRQFYDHILPEIAKSLKKIANELEKINERQNNMGNQTETADNRGHAG